MIKINSALLFYLVAFILYSCSVFLQSENLELFSRPIIIPSIYYFYYISVKGKVSFLFSTAMLSFFIGEILFLISHFDFVIQKLIFFLLPYFIVIYFFSQDFLYYLKKKKYGVNSLSFHIILLLLFYLLYNVLSFINEPSKLEFSIYISYGILLIIMSIMAFLIQFNFNNKTILYMSLVVVSFIVSDVFFIFSENMKDVLILKLVNVIFQQASYFLFVAYFINRSRFKNSILKNKKVLN